MKNNLFQFIYQNKKRWPITTLCRVLNVARSGFYKWKKKIKEKPTQKQMRKKRLLRMIRLIHAQNKDYGSPRIQPELQKQGEKCNLKTVAQWMKENNIRARKTKKFVRTTDSKHRLPVAKNLLDRDFTADKPNQKWVADTTFIRTLRGWFYLTTIMDLFSRKIVGWKVSNRIDATLAKDALQMAIWMRRPQEGLIVHTDRGSQFCSQAFQNLLTQNGLISSMSRKANCWDNAPMESFYRSLKAECVHWENYVCELDVQQSLNRYIDHYYNRRRLHSTLKYVSPVEFEMAH